MLPNNDTWRKNKCNCWENIIIPRICLVIPKIRKLKTIKNHIEWIFILVHYSLVQMSTWNYHLQKTNWYFLVNGLVAVRNGCWCSLKVTICSCFSGKSDESGNKLVMFSKNLYLAQCFFLSFLFALCLTQECPDSLVRVNRERDGEDEGSRNETQTDREIQKQGLREDVRTWEIVHVSILELLALKFLSYGRLKWHTPRTGKRSSHNDVQHFVINQCVKKWGKDAENERKKRGDIYVLII